MLAGQGDTAGATAAYQLAIDSGHAEHGPMAALNLGNLRDEQGDTDGAEAAYRLAIESVTTGFIGKPVFFVAK